MSNIKIIVEINFLFSIWNITVGGYVNQLMKKFWPYYWTVKYFRRNYTLFALQAFCGHILTSVASAQPVSARTKIYKDIILSLKVPITTAADEKFCGIFPNFRKKIKHDIT